MKKKLSGFSKAQIRSTSDCYRMAKSRASSIKKYSSFIRYAPTEGINTRGQSDPKRFFAKLRNMYIDNDSGMLSSVPGFRKILSLQGKIYSIFSLTDLADGEMILLHAGSGLYGFDKNLRDSKVTPEALLELSDRQSYYVCYGDIAFITDGEALYKISRDEICEISRDERICGCRCLCVFDGRLFVSGNPNLPGRIFYSTPIRGEEMKFDFEACITFSAPSPVCSLLCRGDELWVFKTREANDGGIICYKKEGDGEYSPTERIFGIRCQGGGVAVTDEILFFSQEGLCAIEKAGREDQRIFPRSENISFSDPKDYRGMAVGVFDRYVALFFGGRIYLGDMKSLSEGGYAWYIIDGVGSYRNDRRIYRYSAESIEGYSNGKNTDAIARGEIISLIDGDGRKIFYEDLFGAKNLVYPTEEFVGGEFYPATSSYFDGELLWFGTACGDLCLFNNDLIKKEKDEFGKENANTVNEKSQRGLYSFCSHPSEYLIEYQPDDLGFSNMVKSTVPRTFLLRAISLGDGEIRIRVKTDGREVFNEVFNTDGVDFSDFNFGGLSSSTDRITNLVIPERAFGWLEKQIRLEGKSFSSPIIMDYIGFSFDLRGVMKKSY